jgi:Na+-transporting methylmalonyl-CoA/oxaloacetate decarboxylase gamma subunit
MITMDFLFVSSIDLKTGITISVVGLGIIFLVLIILVIVFNRIPVLLKIPLRKKFLRSGKNGAAEECCKDISGETNAVITLALHLYMNELHDIESTVMTISRVSKRYSPWNSKIYGLRNFHFSK